MMKKNTTIIMIELIIIPTIRHLQSIKKIKT